MIYINRISLFATVDGLKDESGKKQMSDISEIKRQNYCPCACGRGATIQISSPPPHTHNIPGNYHDE